MTIDEKLEKLREELARQDAELEANMCAIRDLPQNLEAVVPHEALRDIEEACSPRIASPQGLPVGIRM